MVGMIFVTPPYAILGALACQATQPSIKFHFMLCIWGRSHVTILYFPYSDLSIWCAFKWFNITRGTIGFMLKLIQISDIVRLPIKKD